MTDDQFDRLLASLASLNEALASIDSTLATLAQSAVMEDGGMNDGQVDPLRTFDSK